MCRMLAMLFFALALLIATSLAIEPELTYEVFSHPNNHLLPKYSECGNSRPPIKTRSKRVPHGRAVLPGVYPWLALLVSRNGEPIQSLKSLYICVCPCLI